jgi:hypothetical protein
VAIDAAAGPILLLSSGRVGGTINPITQDQADASFLETQQLLTTSWTLDGQDSAEASQVSAHLESTVTDSGVIGTGVLDLLLTAPANGDVYGDVGADYIVGFTLTETMRSSLSIFGHAEPPQGLTSFDRMTVIVSGPGWEISDFFQFGPGLFTQMPAEGVFTPGDYQIYLGFLLRGARPVICQDPLTS